MNTRKLLGFVLAVVLGTVAHAADITIQRGVVYAQPDGEQLRLDVYAPRDAGTKLRPGMILIHGGGWIVGTRRQQSWYSRGFAAQGYVVMSIGYRMMPKYPFPACLHDCKAAVRWMRLHAEEYRIDPERIVTFGASAGGHLAALLAATTPEDGFEGTENPGPSSAVAAAISLYGVLDLTKYRTPPRAILASGDGAREYMRRFGTDAGLKKGLDPFEYASPITYAKAGMAPVYLAHGTGDQLVHYEQAVAFYERLKMLGVATTLHTFLKRNHGFDYVHWGERKQMFDEMLAFLAQYIGPVNAAPAEDAPSV